MSYTGITNSSGVANIQAPAGEYNVKITKEGYETKELRQVFDETHTSLDVTHFDPVAPPHDCTITCINKYTSEPLEGVEVTIGTKTILSDAGGKTVFTLEDGSYTYEAKKAHWNNVTETFTMSGSDLSLTAAMTEAEEFYNVNFTVTDEDGEPIANASINVVGAVSMATDAEGKASIQLDNGSYEFSVGKDGYATFEDEVVVDGADVDVDVTLTSVPMYNVTVRAKDIDNNPIQDAEVILNMKSQVTDAEGKTVITCPTGTYDVTVRKNGYADYEDTVTVNDTDVEKDCILEIAGYTVTFTVTDMNGNPLQDIGAWEGVDELRTDENGEVTFIRQNGTYNFQIGRMDYEPSMQEVTVNGENVHRDVVLRMADCYPITFSVTSEHTPLEGALVEIGNLRGTTSADGTCILNVPKNNWVNYKVTKEGYVRAEGTIESDSEKTVDIVLNLPTMRTLNFNVTGLGWSPLEGATIYIDGQTLTTDSNGQASTTILEDTYEILATATDYENWEGVVEVVGDTQKDIWMASIYKRISFNVTDMARNPIEGATVNMNGESKTTGGHGDTYFDVLEGTYDYEVSHPDYETKTGTVTDQNYVDVMLQGGADAHTVTFTVTNEKGEYLEGVHFDINHNAFYTDSHGVLSLMMENGSFTAYVDYDGYRQESIDVTVDGADVSKDVTLIRV